MIGIELNSTYKLNNQVIDYSMFDNRKKTMSTKDLLNNRLNNLNCLPKTSNYYPQNTQMIKPQNTQSQNYLNLLKQNKN